VLNALIINNMENNYMKKGFSRQIIIEFVIPTVRIIYSSTFALMGQKIAQRACENLADSDRFSAIRFRFSG
jgi:hypothetical protein